MKGKLSSINYQAFQDLLQKLRAEKKICSARAQGIGKSYLIVAFCDEYEKQGKKVLILSTSNRIFDHQIAPRMTAKNVIYATYQATLSNNFVIPKVDLVIADEFHRLGGEVWRMKFEEILNQNPNVEVLGISAEYERGDGRCMDIELFNGHMYENIPMADAFIKGIYKFNVSYIMTYYKLDEPFQGAAKKFMEMNNLDPNYIKAKEMWEKIRSEWHMVNGVPTVIGNYAVQALHNYFTPSKGRQKIAIFVERLDQVDGMDSLFTSWFTDPAVGFKKVNIHKLSSRKSRKQNDMALKEFMTPRSSIYELDILVSVNMLNEGVHVSNLNAVMFLRGTKSPVLYRQQLGRCFDSVKTDNVIVFDFVGNWETATGYKVSNRKLINSGLESIPEPESPLMEVHNKEEEYRNTVNSNYEPKLKVIRLGTPIINFINVLSKLLGRNTSIDYEAMCKDIIKNKAWDKAKMNSNPSLYRWIYYNRNTNPYAKIIWDHICTKQSRASRKDYEAMCKGIIENKTWDKARYCRNKSLYIWVHRNKDVNPYAKIIWNHINVSKKSYKDYEAMCEDIIKNKTWDKAKISSNLNLYHWILYNKDTNPYAKIVWDHISTKKPRQPMKSYKDYETTCKGIIENNAFDEARRISNINLYSWIRRNRNNPYAKIIWNHINFSRTSCEDYEAMCEDIIKNEAWDKAKKSSNPNLYKWIRRNKDTNPYAKIVWDHIKCR